MDIAVTSLLSDQEWNAVILWLNQATASANATGQTADVHIDELCPALRSPSAWVQGSIELLARLAAHHESERGGSVMYIACHIDPEPGVDLGPLSISPSEWPRLLSSTPPELVVIGTNQQESYAAMFQSSKFVPRAFSVGGHPIDVYVSERLERFGQETELVRHLWLVLNCSIPGA